MTRRQRVVQGLPLERVSQWTTVLLSVPIAHCHVQVWQLADSHAELDARLKNANAELDYLVGRFSAGLDSCKTTSERLMNKLEERCVRVFWRVARWRRTVRARWMRVPLYNVAPQSARLHTSTICVFRVAGAVGGCGLCPR